MDAIVAIQIARLVKLLEPRKIALTLDPKARTWLANSGYDPVYGARPLKRVIQKHLQDALAQAILSGAIADGAEINVSVEGRQARAQRHRLCDRRR